MGRKEIMPYSSHTVFCFSKAEIWKYCYDRRNGGVNKEKIRDHLIGGCKHCRRIFLELSSVCPSTDEDSAEKYKQCISRIEALGHEGNKDKAPWQIWLTEESDYGIKHPVIIMPGPQKNQRIFKVIPLSFDINFFPQNDPAYGQIAPLFGAKETRLKIKFFIHFFNQVLCTENKLVLYLDELAGGKKQIIEESFSNWQKARDRTTPAIPDPAQERWEAEEILLTKFLSADIANLV